MGHPRETPSRGSSVGGRALEADAWPWGEAGHDTGQKGDVAGAVRLSPEGGVVRAEGRAEDPGNTRSSGADAGKGLRQGPSTAERRGPGCNEGPRRRRAQHRAPAGSAGCHKDERAEARRRAGVRGS